MTDLAQRGMMAAQEAMMTNGGMMGRGMHGDVLSKRDRRHFKKNYRTPQKFVMDQ